MSAIAKALAATAMLLLAFAYCIPTILDREPPLTFEQTVVLMLLNHATAVTG